MIRFSILLAGHTVEISAFFPSTKQFCVEYLTEKAPEFQVSISQADIDDERIRSAREDELEGIPVRHFSDAYLETLAVYRKLALGLLNYDVLLFHGSVVAVDGEGYLFTAKSGTGKSTHTRLWRQKFGSRAVMVNDDKPLLIVSAEGVTACGTPWDGKHRLSTNIQVPLKGLCILERSVENHIHPISPKEAFPMLMQQSYRPEDAPRMLRTLALLERLQKTVPLYRLGCNMEQEAAEVAYRGMKGAKP